MLQLRLHRASSLDWKVPAAILGAVSLSLGLIIWGWLSLTGIQNRWFDQAWLLAIGIPLGVLGLATLPPLFLMAAYRWLRPARFSLLELLCGVVIVSLALTAAYNGYAQSMAGGSPFIQKPTPATIFSVFFYLGQQNSWAEYGGIVDCAACLFTVVSIGILILGARSRWLAGPRFLSMPVLVGVVVLAILGLGTLDAFILAIPCFFLLLVLGLKPTTAEMREKMQGRTAWFARRHTEPQKKIRKPT